MSLIFSQVKTSVYNWVIANIPSGMPAIYTYSNAPRPLVDYVTILFSNLTQIGWDYTPSPTDSDGDVVQTGDRELIVQIQAFGGDPFTILENLRTSLQKQSTLDSLIASGLAVGNWFPIQDITSLVDSRYEQRASMDVLFRLAQKYSDILGTIEQTEITEEIFNVDGSVILDQTVLIPLTI